jgi:hypothetical protein
LIDDVPKQAIVGPGQIGTSATSSGRTQCTLESTSGEPERLVRGGGTSRPWPHPASGPLSTRLIFVDGSLSLFASPRPIGDISQLPEDVRLVDEFPGFVEAICLENGLDHLRSMTMTRKLAGHLQHLGNPLVPRHNRPAHSRS